MHSSVGVYRISDFSHDVRLKSMVKDTYSSSFSATELQADPGQDFGFLACLCIWPKTTAALGLATVTMRWHDGTAARSKVIICALTTLGNYTSEVFPLYCANGHNITIEAVLVGVGAEFNIGSMLAIL